MPPIDWIDLLEDLIPILVECFNAETDGVETARRRIRNPEILPVLRLARAARKRSGAPRRETFVYMRAILGKAASLTDAECDELYREATEE